MSLNLLRPRFCKYDGFFSVWQNSSSFGLVCNTQYGISILCLYRKFRPHLFRWRCCRCYALIAGGLDRTDCYINTCQLKNYYGLTCRQHCMLTQARKSIDFQRLSLKLRKKSTAFVFVLPRPQRITWHLRSSSSSSRSCAKYLVVQELNTALPNLRMLHYKKRIQFVVSDTDWAKENIITLKKLTLTPFLRLPLQVNFWFSLIAKWSNFSHMLWQAKNLKSDTIKFLFNDFIW